MLVDRVCEKEEEKKFSSSLVHLMPLNPVTPHLELSNLTSSTEQSLFLFAILLFSERDNVMKKIRSLSCPCQGNPGLITMLDFASGRFRVF